MRVFVTGASGFVGSAVVRELLDAGHQVLGLARSDRAAEAVRAAGAEVHRGSIDDPADLAEVAATTDGVVHTAYNHDFSQYEAAGRTERAVVTAIGEALAGSGRPLVVTAGIAGFTPGRLVTEDDEILPGNPRTSEPAALAFTDRGVRVSVVRLPPSTHGEGDHGFVPVLVDIARRQGFAGYPGDGSNRWASVHRLDAARLFRLALESAPAGTRLHPVDDAGVPMAEIHEVIGRHLDLPVRSVAEEDLVAHYGWMGRFVGIDVPASSERTREAFGWEPTQVGLLADLEAGHYFAQRPTLV